MSLTILDRGEGRYDLLRGDTEIGWIAERAIGFGGFEDRAAARRAASVAYDALNAWLARQRRVESAPRNGRALRVRRDGTAIQLTLGDVPVGRLLAHDVGSDVRERGTYAFELLLPPRVGSSISAAQVVHNALERHRAVRAARQVAALV